MPAQYTCVVHSRDWVPGRPVPDQILESVESSRRTLIVLSSHYVQSMWSNLEFRAAHSKAIEENIQVLRIDSGCTVQHKLLSFHLTTHFRIEFAPNILNSL